MSLRTLLAAAVLLGSLAAHAADPLQTDPDKYSLVLENDRVRVLRYHDEPGAKTSEHKHPDLVLHALGNFKRRLTVVGGRTWEREFKAGETVFIDGQTHIGENVGTTPTDVIITELKEPRKKAAPKKPARK